MKRSGAIAVVAAVSALLMALGAFLAGSSRAGAEPPAPTERQALDSVLRLAELPTGYVLGGRQFCDEPRRPSEEEAGGIRLEEGEEPAPPTPYDVFLAHTATSSCVFAYERLYRAAGTAAGSPAVFSFVLATPSVAAATEALADGRLSMELGAKAVSDATVEDGFRAAGPPPSIGEGSRRFRTDHFYFDEIKDTPGTMVVWRQGKLVGGILAGGAKPAVNDATAARDGALQQKLMEAPRPYDEAESEDIPTFLGNPNLGVPVYWLGKEFSPGHGIEGDPFVRADARERLDHPGAGRRMSMEYRNELYLDSWTPSGWRKFARTKVGRQMSPHCARSRTVKVPEGHAVIYSAYGKDRVTCPRFAPNQLFAVVFLPGAVVAVGESLCTASVCESNLAPEFSYSFANMAALARGLHRWKPNDAAPRTLARPGKDGSRRAQTPSRPAQIGMLMRLHELPPGYVLGDEGVGCGIIDPEGTEPPLTPFLARHLPKVCEATYERVYPVTGKGADPPKVLGAVIDLRSSATARAAEKMLPALIARVTGDRDPAEGSAGVAIGAQTRLFHGHSLVGGHVRPASLIAWRQGRLIGLTLVGGEAAAPGDREAIRMARRQRAHMLRPTPYRASERDDVLVPLENPAIALPVYWLGRSFDPGVGAPLKLTSAYGPLLEGEAPTGTKLELWYDQGALHLGTWTPASWQLYRSEKLGHELLDWKCTKTAQLPVAGGSATLYAGYGKNYASCPSKAPDVFAAVAEVGGVVLGMGLPSCYTCVGGGPDRAELEAAVAALKPFHPRS